MIYTLKRHMFMLPSTLITCLWTHLYTSLLFIILFFMLKTLRYNPLFCSYWPTDKKERLMQCSQASFLEGSEKQRANHRASHMRKDRPH